MAVMLLESLFVLTAGENGTRIITSH
ncbi:MAG: hypothetical protein RL370_208, partial [Actinomycetota bacterium]